MKSEISNYLILDASSPKNLNVFVKEHLAEGWKIYGTPFAAAASNGYGIYQAMVIYEPDEIEEKAEKVAYTAIDGSTHYRVAKR